MAVNPNDAAYKAEVVPDSIKRLGVLLRAAYGVGPDNFGDRGNLAHTSGYHRSRRYNQVHVPGNYSIQLAADRQGDENWIAAFDITPSVWGSPDNRRKMIALTKRMREAARIHDPRVRNLREFAGTEDGTHVVTIDMQTGADRDPFDSTHLDHGHGSFFRGRAAEDHAGIFEVITGTRLQEDDVLDLTTPVHVGDYATDPRYPDAGENQTLAGLWLGSYYYAIIAKANTDQLLAAAAADQTRDAALLAAVQALTVATGMDPAPILSAIAAARDDTHALVTQLQQQLAEVQARALKQAQALAAAGVALDSADD